MPEFTAYAVTDKSSISPFGKRVVEYVKPFNERLDSIANSASNAIDVVNKKIVDKLYREHIPQKERIYGEAVFNAMLGRDPGTITSKDFTKAEMKALQQIVDDFFRNQKVTPLGKPAGNGSVYSLGQAKPVGNSSMYSLGQPKPAGDRYQYTYLNYDLSGEPVRPEVWEWLNTLGNFGIRTEGDKAIVYDKYNFDNEPPGDNSIGAKYRQPMNPFERFGNVVYDTWFAPEGKRSASAAGLAYIRDNGPKVRIEVPLSR